MYKRNAQGWSKHLDFMLVDELSLQVAFILAVLIRLGTMAYATTIYRNLAILLILFDLLVMVLHNSMHDVMKRGYYVEFIRTFEHSFYVFGLTMCYIFATQAGKEYSRIILALTFGLHLVLGYIYRILWKSVVKVFGLQRGKRNNILVVTTPENAEGILQRLSGKDMVGYVISGVVLTEKTDEEKILNYPIVSDLDGVSDYIVREWIDSVYIDAPFSDERIVKLMDDCSVMAVPTHFHVPNMTRNGVKRFSEKLGGTTVLTTSINYATPLQSFIKRLFDVIIGLIGSIFAILIMIVVGPIIKKKSPGPILFKQERIGQNGKHFYMYKLRTMYMDAEEKKKELMAQNRIKDGMMFKLDFDPRIIGNKILPDGTKKTGIGEFLRKTSLDEFPQFFNVLGGSMSMIGTRPPTVDEWSKYELHHRARLATKPGITGLWQVSGRSEITDFEEVVKLDTEYIANWSIGQDLKILFKTFGAVLRRKGAM